MVLGMLFIVQGHLAAVNIVARPPGARVACAMPAAHVNHAVFSMPLSVHCRFATFNVVALSARGGVARATIAENLHYVVPSVRLAVLRRLAAFYIESPSSHARGMRTRSHSRQALWR